MTLRHLEIFVAVANMGSMTAASEQLYISQPTVSQAIMELERYYGTKLFDRMAKKLYMTQAGERLLSYARHITSLVSDMSLQMTAVETTGRLRVGASATVGILFLPDLVKAFKETSPSLQVSAIIKNTLDIEQLILKNDLDLGLVEGDVHSTDLAVTTFEGDELVVVCGRDHRLYGVSHVEPQWLEAESYLMREEGSGTRELFEYAMTAQNLNFEAVWESSSFESITAAAVKNIGLAVLSRALVDEQLRDGSLWHVPTPFLSLKRQWRVIYHKNKYLTEGMKAFVEISLKR